MSRVVIALVALAGCRQVFGLSDPIPPPGADAPVGNGDGADGNGAFCLGAPGWQICVPTPPTAPISLPTSIDTESFSGLCLQTQPTSWSGAGQSHACIIIGTNITGTTVYATGQYPLVLVASDSISIGTLDVSSHGGGSDPGAGAGSQGCGNAGTGTSSGTSGGGGGAGGSFMTKGGGGGTGASGAVAGGSAAAADVSVPAMLRGGCRGASGGDGTTVGNHGRNGEGGGAVYLVAGSQITISSAINASGAGGGGGGTGAGGAGGAGTGGSIVLHAPSIIATAAALIANGGGGGSGGTVTSAGGGGSNPSTQSPTTPAQGSTTTGATGGNGFAGASAATNGVGGSDGGGGGGGGGGYIRANVMPSGATISPTIDIR